MNKIAKALFIIIICSASVSASTYSYFHDSTGVENNVFSTGYWQTEKAIVINEVYYDTGNRTYNPGNNIETEGKNEWIELYNPNNFAVNIKNWTITDNTHVKTINPNVSIPAYGFALLSHDNSTWHFWGNPSGSKIVTINLTGNTNWLSNSGDRVILTNDQGAIVDQMSYGTDTSIFNPACPDVAEGHSLERNPLGKDTDVASDFVERITPTPGS